MTMFMYMALGVFLTFGLEVLKHLAADGVIHLGKQWWKRVKTP